VQNLLAAPGGSADPHENQVHYTLPDKQPKRGTALKLLLTGLYACCKGKLYYFKQDQEVFWQARKDLLN
jgi:hypothetical protein